MKLGIEVVTVWSKEISIGTALGRHRVKIGHGRQHLHPELVGPAHLYLFPVQLTMSYLSSAASSTSCCSYLLRSSTRLDLVSVVRQGHIKDQAAWQAAGLSTMSASWGHSFIVASL